MTNTNSAMRAVFGLASLAAAGVLFADVLQLAVFPPNLVAASGAFCLIGFILNRKK